MNTVTCTYTNGSGEYQVVADYGTVIFQGGREAAEQYLEETPGLTIKYGGVVLVGPGETISGTMVVPSPPKPKPYSEDELYAAIFDPRYL